MPESKPSEPAPRDYGAAYFWIGVLSVSLGAGLFHPGAGLILAGLGMMYVGLVSRPMKGKT